MTTETLLDAAELLAAAETSLAVAAGAVRDALVADFDLVTPHVTTMLLTLTKVERQVRAIKILAAQGLLIDRPIPLSAQPHLQGLIHCRAALPSDIYDHFFHVVVRGGRAYIVEHQRRNGHDKHYFQRIAGPEWGDPIEDLRDAFGDAAP